VSEGCFKFITQTKRIVYQPILFCSILLQTVDNRHSNLSRSSQDTQKVHESTPWSANYSHSRGNGGAKVEISRFIQMTPVKNQSSSLTEPTSILELDSRGSMLSSFADGTDITDRVMYENGLHKILS
jgi:hypothetical protein